MITSNKYESTEEVYIYSTETVDYISTISMPSAKRMYFSDMYDLGLVTELDYNLIVYGDDYEADIEITPGYMSSTYLYIRGYIKFRNDTGTEYPAQDVTIDIYDDDPIIGYHLLKSIKTSSTGYYTTSVQNDSSWLENGGLDIIVRVYFGNDDFHVEDFIFSYFFDFPKIDNVSDGTLIRQSVTFDANTERNEAMTIYQAGIVGFKYLRYLDYKSYYPYLTFDCPSFTGESYYTPILHTIDLEFGYHSGWDTVLHEFGHFVGDLYGLHDFWPSIHGVHMNLIDTEGKDIGSMLAWAEGFGSYYSVVSQLRYGTGYVGVRNAGDNLYGNNNIENNSYYLLGEGNEWVDRKSVV